MTWVKIFVVLMHLFYDQHSFRKQTFIASFFSQYFSRSVSLDQLGPSGSAAVNDFTSVQCVIAIYEHRQAAAPVPVSRESENNGAEVLHSMNQVLSWSWLQF